jgi:hypothetical protein
MNKKRIFTFLVAILPITMVYKSPIPEIDLGTFSILLFASIVIVSGYNLTIKQKTSITLSLFLIYTVFGTLFSILLQSNINYILTILRMGKFVILITIVLFIFHHKFFDYKYGIKVIRIVSLIAVTYAIIQTISYNFFGILLPRAFLNLIIDESYMHHDYLLSASKFYRPPAFFIEPASFVQYVILYLTYCIFGQKNQHIISKPIEALFISLGIILSGSGQGLILLVVVWGIWFFKNIIFAKINMERIIIFIIIIIGIVVLIPKIIELPVIAKNLDRITGESTLSLGYAGEARIIGFSYFSQLSDLLKVIGTGYGNVPSNVYFSSASYTLYTGGYVGITLVIAFIIESLTKSKYYQSIFIILYVVLIIGTTAFYAANICYYFSFILCSINESKTLK